LKKINTNESLRIISFLVQYNNDKYDEHIQSYNMLS